MPEKELEEREKKIVKTFFGVGLIIFVLTLVNFAIHGRLSFFGDIDHDYLSAFGSFLGSTVGLLVSTAATYLVWMTLKAQREDIAGVKAMAQKQIDLSLKPDLYILDEEVVGHVSLASNGRYYPWTILSVPSNSDKDLPQVSLVNIGIGAAKKITYKWDFDLTRIAAYINTADGGIAINLRARNALQITLSETVGGVFISTPYLSENQLDIIVPYRIGDSYKRIPIPYPYLLSFYLTVYLMLESAEKKTLSEDHLLENFPQCILSISYMDALNNTHKKQFTLVLKEAIGSMVKTSGANPAFSGKIGFVEQLDSPEI
ncbi:hypothetical protein [Dyadobacter sp. CY351]|uniref:hypothetical protein n=1 Tax=Dyadobacter sp. CY351 TaxID=2909337 RepID=UPI001F43A79D|nr:hypothetical protein [Dyadobacter sp. CY351]MCF2516041.1 hypothetical protein [Dyadobacter sp. CY351]